MVKNPLSNIEDTGLTLGQGTKITTCSGAIKPTCYTYKEARILLDSQLRLAIAKK